MGLARGRKRQFDLLTIGHSTRPIDGFTGLLQENGVTFLADIRTVPKSRYNPQYWGDQLSASLAKVGIGYLHFPGLGGLRKARKDSIHVGWRNRSFQGYSDYMETDEFQESLEELVRLSGEERVAIMCAEAVPWRCHRNLVADALTVRGMSVGHIMAPGKVSVHRVTAWATVQGDRLVYGAENVSLGTAGESVNPVRIPQRAPTSSNLKGIRH